MTLEHQLAQFTGSTKFTRFGLLGRVIASEGVMFLANEAQCFWLLDAIAAHLGSREFKLAADRDDRLEDLSFWRFERFDPEKDGKNSVLTCVADTGEAPAVRQEFVFTTFPLKEITIWAGRNELGGITLYLPSEH